ncbi:MAG: sulfotransferase [Pseudoruegeria sp.]
MPELLQPHAPMPFIVGVGRSGTTLLRLMLDSHPDMAVPPEFNWLEPVLLDLQKAKPDPGLIYRKIIQSQSWQDLGIPNTKLKQLAETHLEEGPEPFLRAIYQTYSHRVGKSRVGDKTPKNLLRMSQISHWIPEAYFIHIIRDCRDVVYSWKNVWIGENSTVTALARMWCEQLEAAERQKSGLPYYTEIRYEDLIRFPQKTLSDLCEKIQLDMHDKQLSYFTRTSDRLTELKAMKHHRVISAQERQEMFAQVYQAPNPARIGRWKQGLSTAEVEQILDISAPKLLSLGYEI